MSFSDEQKIYQWVMYGIMIGASSVVGYCQVATEFACKKYVYQCTWKERKAQAFVRRIDNIPPVAGALGLVCSGLYYQFIHGDNLSFLKLRDYGYILFGVISVAFSLSLVLPRAPYSERKVEAKKQSVRRASCCYGGKIFSHIFRMKMLWNLFHILPSASIQGLFEMVCFIFLFYNTTDKTNFNPFALPVYVLSVYHLTSFLFGACRCKKCYGNSYDDNRSKCCGAFTNIILISGATTLVILGSLADNNIGNLPSFLKNFTLYFSVAVALGLTQTLLAK